MTAVNRDVDLLKLLRGENKPTENSGVGLYIVKVITAQPEVTLVFEGTQLPLDLDIFEVPVKLLPLEEGARYFALPIIGNGQRWGLLEKIDGEGVKGTFTSSDNKTITVENGLIKKIQ